MSAMARQDAQGAWRNLGLLWAENLVGLPLLLSLTFPMFLRGWGQNEQRRLAIRSSLPFSHRFLRHRAMATLFVKDDLLLGPGELVLRVEDGTRRREAVARARRSLEEFLAAQGLAGVTVRAEAATLAAHPVSGKFRQVWRAKAPAAEPTSSRPPGRGSRRPRSGP